MDWASVAGFLLAISGIVFGQVLEGGRLDALLRAATRAAAREREGVAE